MNYLLFDGNRTNLFPFTFTRPVGEIRIGILTIREKWERHFHSNISFLTENYLAKKFPTVMGKQNILLNGSVCPNDRIVNEIIKLKEGQKLVHGNVVIAMNTPGKATENLLSSASAEKKQLLEEISSKLSAKDSRTEKLLKINNLWDIFHKNGDALIEDLNLLTNGRRSKQPDKTNKIIGKDFFLEEGANVSNAVINSETGPVYIGKDAEIMEGSLIRGPFALCEHAVLKLGAKIYGPTTIGPHCKVGGEVNNSVFFGFSNKAHDGFMGNSVIGEWCNIGADTNTSNLKNTYGEVEVWSYRENKFKNSGLQFCGLFMGDHSKCGINTMFNTGTVVGICANVFGSGFPRKFIPDFSWGGPQGFETYKPEKVFEVEKEVYKRRDLVFGETEKDILNYVFALTKEYRHSPAVAGASACEGRKTGRQKDKSA